MSHDQSGNPGETLSGAQIVVRLLERQGIRCVAGVPGGAILPFLRCLVAVDADSAHPRAPRTRVVVSWRRAWRV